MKAPSETAIFYQNLQALNKLPRLTDRELLTQLLNSSDLSSLPNLDNPTYNTLIRCLKAYNQPVQQSARFYIASELIKSSRLFATYLKDYLIAQTAQPRYFLPVLQRIDEVDEEDFKLCCQMIALCPLSHLKLGDLNDLARYGWSDLAKKRLPQLLSALHNVSSVCATSYFSNETWETFCQIISSLPKLSELDLSDSDLSMLNAVSCSNLGDVFASLPNLSKLLLKNAFNIFRNGNQWWPAFYQALSRATHLVSLDVSENLLISYRNSLEIFCNAVSKLDQLESLNLSDCDLNSLHATDWQHLSKLSRLTTLNLGGNYVGDDPENWQALCSALKSLPHLRSLYLSSNNLWNVSDEGWEAFTPLLMSLQHLSLANMANNGEILPSANVGIIEDKDWRSLFRSLQTSNLISLDLSSIPKFFMCMDDACFDLFCQAVVGARYLSKLDVSDGTDRGTFDGISKERFEKFCKAVLAASHLSAVNFDSDIVRPDLMPILLDTLTKAKHLSSIDLGGNSQLDVAGWNLFWNDFNKATHITTLGLCVACHLDVDRWKAFTDGISQARHLTSLSISSGGFIYGDKKPILWSALDPLFNLVEFKFYSELLPPQIVALLRRNHRLFQFKAEMKKLTTQLNLEGDLLNINQVKQAVEGTKRALNAVLQILPDHPNSQIFLEEMEPLVNDLSFACARWFAKNNEPKQAIDYYTLIPLGSTHFTKARGNAFTIAYQAYRSEKDTATQAFSKALPLCLESDRFILLDAEFQRTFDAFLLEAIGLTKTLELIPKVTPELRLKMFKYLSLLVLKEELLNIKSTDQTDFFQKVQVSQGLVDMLASCKLLSTFEELTTLDVDGLWSSAKLKYDMARIPGEFEFYTLLCQVIKQLGEAPGLTEASQVSPVT